MTAFRSTLVVVDRRSWLVPGVVLLTALAWIGGHFSGYAIGVAAQLLDLLAHLAPIAIVAVALLACVRGAESPLWRSALLGVAISVKAFTVFAIVWAVTHPSGFGPHGLLDWVPIGTANAGAGLILLAFIRSRSSRRAGRPAVTT